MKTTWNSLLVNVKLLIKPRNFNSHQSKEIDKIAHQAYNNFEVKKEFNK